MVKRTKSVKAPELQEGRDDMTSATSTGMITMLQRVDRRTRLSIRVLQGVYVIMTLVAAGYTIILEEALVRAGMGFLTVAFALVIGLQQLRYRAYDQTYEDVPMREYLHRAKVRLRVLTPRTWLVIPIWILIDIAVCLFVIAAAEHRGFNASLVIGGVQVALILIVALDFLVDYLVWRKEHRPAVREIDRVIEELDRSGE